MDDFNVSALHESKNEWGARLVTLLTPLVIDGYKSILEESIKLCKDNNEMDKYLMTFQNLISRIPKWNQQIVENERKRICEKSACNYLEDLVTCVHIIQLKVLTAMRVGQKQKKIDINVPNDLYFIQLLAHDLDGDGYKELVLPMLDMNGKAQVLIYRTTDNKSYTNATSTIIPNNQISLPPQVIGPFSISDVDGNGSIDLFVIDKNKNQRWEWNGSSFLKK